MQKQNYYLGLDIGTNSIGWAVTDESYNLLRAKGKDLWGVRQFREAQTAAERRTHRSSRRRNDRKKIRLQLLREIFEDEIRKVDPLFYERLAESKYWQDEKKVKGKFSLFNDKMLTDKEYHTEYPTIFHLRKALIDKKTNGDIRLYFLAVHQMLKRRGHFLFEGQKFNSIHDLEPYIDKLTEILSGDEFGIELDPEFYDQLVGILVDSNAKRTDKKNKFKKMIQPTELSKTQKSQLTAMTDLLVSGKTTLKKIFDDIELDELEKNEVDFTNESYDQDMDFLEQELGHQTEVIKQLKAVYDYAKLQEVLHGTQSISDAQIWRYDKHKSDLVRLKKLVRKYDDSKTLYKDIFTDTGVKDNYVNYVGSTNRNGKKITVKKAGREDFFAALKKKLKGACPETDGELQEILKEIDNEEFLPKQIVNTNSVIPYQVHLLELEKIVENLLDDYPSFSAVEDGATKAEKIILLFKFRIPYFVGPLNPAHSNKANANSWIIKKSGFNNTKIRPWNFEQVVDLRACEEEFIKRMTNYCSYLPDQKVLPKSSLLYSEYMVLDALNNLKIDGDKPTVQIKKLIFDEVFLKYRRVTSNRIKTILISHNKAFKSVELTGFDKDFKANMASHIDMREILGPAFDRMAAEEIIELITVHSGNSELLFNKIKDSFPSFSADQCMKLSKLKYQDWGRFSSMFLSDFEGADIETGESGTIMHFLRTTNDNLMQLLSARYNFHELITEYKGRLRPGKVSYDVVDNLYVSPAVKKMIWQVVRVTDEIIKVMGGHPKRLFIEMAREKEDKPQVKESRKSQLLALYRSIKGEERNWLNEIESREEGEFRSKSLYLYYTQMGRCMYSGEPISLDQLFDQNLYDIDHIIPRSKKKDDSLLNNLVLVKRTINQSIKKDLYPVPDKIRREQAAFWKVLKEKGFIGEIKYERLTRSTPLNDEELAGFINRQLVETRQSTKVVADLFKQSFPQSRVVYVKAGLISEFRQDFNILKCREINDLHHAHDAFLNIVVGNGYYSKFTGNALEFVKKNRSYSLNNLFYKPIHGGGGKTVWNPESGLALVRGTIEKPSVLFTVEPYEQHGALYDATIIGKHDIKKGTLYHPTKKSGRLGNYERYGGYKSIKGAYLFLAEHEVKGIRTRSFEFVPLHLKDNLKSSTKALETYCLEVLELKDPQIIKPQILMKSLIEVDGFKYLVNGRTGNRLLLQPAQQPYWNIDQTIQLKKILGALEKSESYKQNYCEDLDAAELMEILRTILAKLAASPYKHRINVPVMIKDGPLGLFEQSKLELCSLIKELLNLLKCTNYLADLRAIGGVKNAGITLMSKTLSKGKSIKMVYQSVTGIYEKELSIN